MRIDRTYITFARVPSWSCFVNGLGYLPTTEAPQEAIDAMKRYDLREFGTPPEKVVYVTPEQLPAKL